MKYTKQGNDVIVTLEKQFDYEPENYPEIFSLPESKEISIECGIWEEKECTLVLNYPSESSSDEKCGHTVIVGNIILNYQNGASRKREYGYTPKVLIAKNEGGFATTGICVDCLLEEIKALPEN